MKRFVVLAWVATALLALGSTRLRAEAAFKKPSENKIYAQTLNDEIARNNPDLIIASLHAVAPGSSDQTMIASTLSLIGEKDDEEDLTVVKQQEMILAHSLTDPKKFKVHMAMKDASGKVMGEIVLIFKNDPTKDEAYYCSRALQIRTALMKKVPSLEGLFRPAN